MMMYIKHAIDQFIERTGDWKSEIMVVMGLGMKEAIEKDHPVVKNTDKNGPTTIFGVEVIIREQIPGEIFGIFHKSCLDHLDDHLEELIDELEEEAEEVEWIQCDLCKHPLNTKLADGDDLKCLWCGDVNDLDDILGNDE